MMYGHVIVTWLDEAVWKFIPTTGELQEGMAPSHHHGNSGWGLVAIAALLSLLDLYSTSWSDWIKVFLAYLVIRFHVNT